MAEVPKMKLITPSALVELKINGRWHVPRSRSWRTTTRSSAQATTTASGSTRGRPRGGGGSLYVNQLGSGGGDPTCPRIKGRCALPREMARVTAAHYARAPACHMPQPAHPHPTGSGSAPGSGSRPFRHGDLVLCGWSAGADRRSDHSSNTNTQ